MENGSAKVDREKCTGCGACAAVCPNHVIEVVPEHKRKPVVLCQNKDKGAQTRKACTAGCIGCMKCRSSLKCCLPEDGAQRVLQSMKEADAVIIGAPCYWGNMPGEVKVLFDRMVYGMMGENSWGMPLPLHKGKKAIVVSTCTTPYPFNILYNQTHGVVKAFREILKWSGFKIVKTIERGGTKKHPELTEKDMRNCKKAVHKLL